MDLGRVSELLADLMGLTIIPFVLVLGIMIFVHELGHFAAARLVGVRVLMFKIGFGRYLFSFKRGHTEYGLGWIPIGGYVKMFGDPTELEGGEEEVALEEIPELDRKEALFFRPASHKLLVFVAGPLMNIVLAFAIAPLVYLIGVERPVIPGGANLVQTVKAGSAGEEAGFQPGDRIVEIAGKKVAELEDLLMAEILYAGEPTAYRVERGGQTLTLTVTPRKDPKTGVGDVGVFPAPYPVDITIESTLEGSAGREAGLKPGDTIVKINGLPSDSDHDRLSEAVDKNKGEPIELEVLRGGKSEKLSVVPRWDPNEKRVLIGLGYKRQARELELKKYGLGRSVTLGAKDCVDYSGLTFVVLYRLITGKLSTKNLTGPLGIGAVTSAAAHSGLGELIKMMVLISINLGILNLLPFPPLDGGHVVITALERITGKKLFDRRITTQKIFGREFELTYVEAIFYVGFSLLISLIVLVTIQDLFRFGPSIKEFFVQLARGLGF